MTMRKGLGKGRGSGYLNIIPRDPMVHKMSAKGMKQPQNTPYSASIEQTPRGLGKAHTDVVPKLKLEQIGGDVDWETYGGMFIVDEKFNNGEFDYYLVIRFTNLIEAVGDDAKQKYMVEVHAVAPSQVSKKDIDSAFESYGFSKEDQKKFRKDPKVLAQTLVDYGLSAPLFDESGDNADKLMDTAKKQVPAITGLFGFYMDKSVNQIGNTGWDFIKGDIGFKSEKMEHKDVKRPKFWMPRDLRFKGETFYTTGHFKDKSEAEQQAKKWRGMGHKSRIVKRRGIAGLDNRPTWTYWVMRDKY